MHARVASSLLALGLLSATSTASALPGVDIGVGAVGIAGLSIIDQASSGTGSDVYPGFAGTRSGFGGVVEARFLGFLGVEAGFVRSNDKGEGDIKFAGKSISASLGQSATHIPVLAKLVLPVPVFSPFVGLGVDFVKPGACSSSLSLEGTTIPTTCFNDSYTMWTGALGAELSLPFLDFIRFPISVRASKHRDFGSDMSDRGSITVPSEANPTAVPSASLRSEWRYDVYGTVGASFFF
jgi:hypothetical protein